MRMAFGRGRVEDGPTTTTTAATTTTTTSQSSGGLTAFIDQGSSFEGKLSFKDTVRIDGHFSGEITSENTLVVGESGEIQANIRSKTVIISGTVVGDIVASQRVVLHKSAHVEGNLDAPSLAIEDGALFNGHITMKGAERKSQTSLKAVEGEKKKSESGGGA
jgi:cytoskeletal protein CcmA (bactofilin family)